MKTFVMILAALFCLSETPLSSHQNKSDYLETGLMIYPKHKPEFADFFNLYQKDPEKFKKVHNKLLNDYVFDTDHLSPLQILYLFGDSKNALFMTDQVGEQEPGEIQNYIDNLFDIHNEWTETESLRLKIDEEEWLNGRFIIQLFQSIDADLKRNQKQLIFLNMGWNAYVFTVVDTKDVKKITDKLPSSFMISSQLKGK